MMGGTVSNSDLLSLAERVERAMGPDRELDVCIDAVRWGACEHFPSNPPCEGWWSEDCGLNRKAPEFTASIDAAMMLVPEGWCIDHGTIFWPGQVAAVHLVGTHEMRDGTRAHSGKDGRVQARHETSLSLALVAASLRAIASEVSK